MIERLLAFIKKHRTAAFIAVEALAIGGICILLALMVFKATPAGPTSTPTALPTDVPGPTPTPMPSPTIEPTPIPCPTPVPSPTVTPDMAPARSITPLDPHALNYMVHVEKSMATGILSIDPANSDMGGNYAYRNDTYTVALSLMDLSSGPVDKIKIHSACTNHTGSNYTLYESDRIDEVLLNPGDKVVRTVGFTVPPDAPAGVYDLKIDVSVYSQKNATWDPGCSYEAGLNILKAP